MVDVELFLDSHMLQKDSLKKIFFNKSTYKHKQVNHDSNDLEHRLCTDFPQVHSVGCKKNEQFCCLISVLPIH